MSERLPFSMSWFAGLGLIALLATLGAAASLVNAGSGPPRTLFLSLPAQTPPPSLTLDALRNTDGSWTLRIGAAGFRFTALCTLAAEPVPVGHAHVYAGDRKLASAYIPVVDLGHLPPGRHEIRVVLRGQDHRALVGPGGLIEARTVIGVPAA